MIFIVVLAFLFGSIVSAPVGTCPTQLNCIKVTGATGACTNGNRQVCIYWDNSNSNCAKSSSDTISHACYYGSKTSTWASGIENKICIQVTPGQQATFAVKDGSGCGSATSSSSAVSGTQGTCAAATSLTGTPWGGKNFCGDNGAINECLWKFNTEVCPAKVDCTVSEWSSWATCTKSCGSGTQTRTRTITVNPLNGGAACPALTAQQSCNTAPCPVNCVVSEWASWSTCSASCGSGNQKRTRTITTNPANGGTTCPDLTQQQSCNTAPCPVNCVVSEWSSWSTCSATCGSGTQKKTRTIKTEAANGGSACPDLTQQQSCNTASCPASVNCVVSEWGKWSSCSKDCGGGTQTQSRTITTNPKNGGNQCPDLTRQQSCNTDACPVDCVVSDWSSWSTCSSTCKGGTQKQTRTIVKESANGGDPCPSQLEKTRTCNDLVPCKSGPLDGCTYSTWGSFTPCSVTCGKGVKTRSRTLLDGNKLLCIDLIQVESCEQADCYVIVAPSK